MEKAEQPKVEKWMMNAAFGIRQKSCGNPYGKLRTGQVAEIIASHAPTPAPPAISQLLLRAVVEMEYMRCAETLELVSSSEGAAIIREGMAALGLKDLSEEEVERVRVSGPASAACQHFWRTRALSPKWSWFTECEKCGMGAPLKSQAESAPASADGWVKESDE